MPELPEVETTRRGIEPHILGRMIRLVIVRQPRLRLPVPKSLQQRVPGRKILAVERRAKYLFLRLDKGSIIIHLGMSGSLRLLPADTVAGPHDHIDLIFDSQCLRLRDPRRFGLVLFTEKDPLQHKLIRCLGPEPLDEGFDGSHLYHLSRNRRTAVKNFIMDSKVVVGVGNIYASEALFRAGILPSRAAERISKKRYHRLAEAIKQVLKEAVEQGGTTLKDFQREDGRAGYFAQKLRVYGLEGAPCPKCGCLILKRIIGQRSSYYCRSCQS